MGSTNRTIRVFIPFLKATIQVLQELTQEVFIKRNVYTYVGNLSNTSDYQVEIGIIGDIRSRVIFTFPKPFAKELTRIMLDIGDEELDDETVEGSVKEIGNMISGNALGLLEEIGLKSDITPPHLYFPGEKVVGDQAQMGVLEFTSNIGNFQVAIVTNENNNVLRNDVICSVDFPQDVDLHMAKFFFPKGIYLLGMNEKNFGPLTSEYTPSLFILNATSPHFKETLTKIIKLPEDKKAPIAIAGDFDENILSSLSLSSPPLKLPLSEDPYTFLENLKQLLAPHLSVYDNRKNIVLDVPQNKTNSAFFLIKTRRGDEEVIPIQKISFDNIVIDIVDHQYINFSERKNLGVRNDPRILLGQTETMKIEKAQITKIISENLIGITLRHILETESGKLSTYLYKVLSE